jgi:integrin beta 3
VEFDGDRTIAIKFVRGAQTKTFPIQLPYLRYQGVYASGKQYEIGDTVTFGGQLWHCNEGTIAPPGDGSKLWQLCVRKGRDGKDGKDAPGALPVVRVS